MTITVRKEIEKRDNKLLQMLKYVKHVILFEALGMFSYGSYDKNALEMRKLKNIYDGKRCFIVATGPSLKKEDLEMLQGEVTFGVNSIFLMYDKTKWRPDYYVCTDASYFEKMVNYYSIRADDLCKKKVFLNKETKKIGDKFHENGKELYIRFSPWNRIYDFERYKYNEDISRGMYAFGTVTNIAMNIAMYMGFKDIYLIGVDCSNLNKHFVNDITDKNKNEKYVNDVIHAQIKGYEIMKYEAAIRGVNVYNATRGGALEVFKRVSLDELFGYC